MVELGRRERKKDDAGQIKKWEKQLGESLNSYEMNEVIFGMKFKKKETGDKKEEIITNGAPIQFNFSNS